MSAAPAPLKSKGLDFALAFPESIAGSLVPVTDNVKAVRDEIATARRVGNVARDGFELATYGISGFSQSIASKVGDFFHYDRMFAIDFGSFLGAIVAGGGAAAWAAHLGKGEFYSALTCAAVAGAVGAIGGVAHIVSNIATKKTRNQRARHVAPTDIDALVKSLSSGTKAEQAIGGIYLAYWRGRLDAAKRITPEAREMLTTAEAALKATDQEDSDRAGRLARISEVMDGPAQLTTEVVKKLRADIDGLEPHARQLVASLVVDAVRQSTRSKDYDAEHALFELPRHYANSQPAELAKAS